MVSALKTNWFAVFIWTIGLVFGAFNIYQSTQVNVALLSSRLDNIEKAFADVKIVQQDLVPRVYVTEQKQLETANNIREIKDSMLRLENKLDILIQQQK